MVQKTAYLMIPMDTHQEGELTIMYFWWLSNMASKGEKIGPSLSIFNPFQSLPSVATEDRKQFQCRKMVFNNKNRALILEFNCFENAFKSFSFLKRR